MNKFQRVGGFYEVSVTLSWRKEKKQNNAAPIKNKLGTYQPQTNSAKKQVKKQTPLKSVFFYNSYIHTKQAADMSKVDLQAQSDSMPPQEVLSVAPCFNMSCEV